MIANLDRGGSNHYDVHMLSRVSGPFCNGEVSGIWYGWSWNTWTQNFQSFRMGEVWRCNRWAEIMQCRLINASTWTERFDLWGFQSYVVSSIDINCFTFWLFWMCLCQYMTGEMLCVAHKILRACLEGHMCYPSQQFLLACTSLASIGPLRRAAVACSAWVLGDPQL